jgi:trans-aconitate 2-methyltransferase
MNEYNIPDQKVASFYDEFSKNQLKTGTNLRHYYLFNRLIKAGMKRNSSVLEIGCGIGTLTGLIANYVTKGSISATDISPVSISVAKSRLLRFPDINFIVSDMSDFNAGRKFDIIVLADVIEHIPLSNHDSLFNVIARHMHNSSVLLINIPHPESIKFFEKHNPLKLQIIDQPVYPHILTKNASANGLILRSYRSYSLFHDKNDYVVATFIVSDNVHYSTISKMKIILSKLFYRTLYWMRLTFFAMTSIIGYTKFVNY